MKNSEVGFWARKCQSLGVASAWDGALISTPSGQPLVWWQLRKRSQTWAAVVSRVRSCGNTEQTICLLFLPQGPRGPWSQPFSSA